MFIQKRRELTTEHTRQSAVDKAAYEHVMGLTIAEVQDLIADEDGDDETGEGDSQPE